MGNKIIDVIKAFAFVGFAVVLVLMMIQDLKDGLGTWGEKGFFLLYVALFLYALWRVFCIVKNMFTRV